MKNLFLGLYILSYGTGFGNLFLCVWLGSRPQGRTPVAISVYFSIFTLAILGPNLEFFRVFFGWPPFLFAGWPLDRLLTLTSDFLLLGLVLYASIRALRLPRGVDSGLSSTFFRMLTGLNFSFLLLFVLGFLWNPQPALLSPLFLENAAYLIANSGSLFFLFRHSRKSEVLKESAPPPPMVPLGGLDSFGLSDREKEIIELLNSGLAGKEIAYQLKIKSVTVKNHIYNIYQKTGVKGRVELLNLFRLKA